MKNLSKEKRDQLILTAITTIGIICGLWMGLISGQIARLDKGNKDLETLSEDIRKATRRIKSREQIQQDLEIVNQKLTHIENGMANGDLYSWFVMTMNNFKVDYKVSIPQISRPITGPTRMLPNFPYESASFQIQGSAYYHELGKFVKQVCTLIYRLLLELCKLTLIRHKRLTRRMSPRRS